MTFAQLLHVNKDLHLTVSRIEFATCGLYLSGRTQWLVSLPPEATARSSSSNEVVGEEPTDDPETKHVRPTELEPPLEAKSLPTSSADTGGSVLNVPSGVGEGVTGSGKRTNRKGKKSTSKANKSPGEKRPRRAAAASNTGAPAVSPATVAQRGAPWLEPWPGGHEYGSFPEEAYYGHGYYTLGMPLEYGDYYAIGGPGGLYEGGLAYMDAASFEAMSGGVAQPLDQDVLHLLQDPVRPVRRLILC